MASELRKAIINVNDIQSELVDVPEWGVKIEVRSMTGLERARLFQRAANSQTGQMQWEHWFPELLIATCYDPETSEKLFDAADRDELNKKSAAALQHLTDVATRLSGLEQSAVEQARGNSEPTPNDGSISS